MTIQLERTQEPIVTPESVLATAMGAPEDTPQALSFQNLRNEPEKSVRKRVLDALTTLAIDGMGNAVTPDIARAMFDLADETAIQLGTPGGYNARQAVFLIAALAANGQNQ